MRKKIVSAAMATVMALGVTAGTMSTANAAPPKADCKYAISAPNRVNAKDSGIKMYAMARSVRPELPGRNTSVKLWIDLYSPASDKFRRVSLIDYDQSPQAAVAVVERHILPGYHKYRAGAEFTCDVGPKTYITRKFSDTVTLHKDIRPFYGVDQLTGYRYTPNKAETNQWGGFGGGGPWGSGEGWGGYGGGGGWGAG